MSPRWNPFDFPNSPDPAVIRTTLSPEAVLVKVKEVAQDRSRFLGSFRRGRPFVASVTGDQFRLSLEPRRQSGYRPLLVGHVANVGGATEVSLHYERPYLWAAQVMLIGASTILPITFVIGVVGWLLGSRNDQGGSMLPLVVLPLVIGIVFLFLDFYLRSEAKGEERDLADAIRELLA